MIHIQELLLKIFIPVSRIFDDNDDIFIFPGMFKNPAAAGTQVFCKILNEFYSNKY